MKIMDALCKLNFYKRYKIETFLDNSESMKD